ncbi:MAG: hypothetical protein JXB85_16380 [Anaerolineales bacterium]|nr:hypothetical protein [Anaerolineales bacterium]
MSQSLSLYRLQQTDSQLSRVQARLDAIQACLEDDENLRQASSTAGQAETQHADCKQRLREAEAMVQEQRVKIEQTEASLYGGNVHNPKELQDLQNEAAALKRFLATLEDRLLETMIALETAEGEHQAADRVLQSVRQQLEQQNQSLTRECAVLQKEQARLMTERAALLTGLPADLIRLYDELRQKRQGIAVAAIAEDSCDACGAFLNQAQVQAVRAAIQPARCPSCGRILYGN